MVFRVMLIALTLAITSVQAQVYKWKDESGVVHYGQRPPAGQSSAEEIGVNAGKPSGTRPIPKAAEEAGESLVNAEPEEAGLDCARAVANARDGIDTMLQVGRKNFRDGYIAKAEYEKGEAALRKVKGSLSVGACRSARGKEQDFYRCISSSHNHVAQCGQKHMP